MAATQPYTLKHPITATLKGPTGETQETITELAVRQATECGDLMVMDAHDGKVAKTIAMIALCTGQPFAVVRKLHPEDFGALSEMVMPFS